MTAPIPPLRKRSTMSWGRRPTPREIADRSKRNGSGVPGARARGTRQYPVDRAIEYLLTKPGRENAVLVTLTLACIIGIGITVRYG